MVKRHLKRLAAPKTWVISRKENVFTTRPNPGRTLSLCMPINVIFRDLLGYVNNTKEAKKILNDKKVLINGIVVKDCKFPVGLMDHIEIPDLKQNFLFFIDANGKFNVKLIKEKLETYKVINKTLLKKGKVQLNLFGGRNILVDKDVYKVGDSIILEKNKVKKHLKFEKGTLIYLFAGRHIGKIGLLEDVSQIHARKIITLKLKDKKIKTSKDYAFVIEKNFLEG